MVRNLQRPTNVFRCRRNGKANLQRSSTKGDKAIAKYASFFDGVTLENIQVSPEEIKIAKNEVPAELKEAIQLAKIKYRTISRCSKNR